MIGSHGAASALPDLPPAGGLPVLLGRSSESKDVELLVLRHEVAVLRGQRQYILAAIHHAGRQIRILGTTAYPTHGWVTQAVRNLLMDLAGAGDVAQVRFLIRDRDGKYPELIDEILRGTKITSLLTGVRMPR